MNVASLQKFATFDSDRKKLNLIPDKSFRYYTGSIPVLHTNLWFQKHLKQLSSSEHLTDVGGQRGGCQQLSQPRGAFFLHNKKEALSGLIQVNDDEERNGGQAGRVYGCQL